MKEFENDSNEWNKDSFSAEDQNEQKPEEGKSNESEQPQTPSEPEQSKTSSDPEPNDPYRYQRASQNGYGSYYEPPRKQPKQGGTPALLIVFCLVLCVFVAISASALFGGFNQDDTGTSDTNTSTDTTGSGDTSSTIDTSDTTEGTTSSKETAPGVTAGSVVNVPTNSSSYSYVANKCINSVVIINVTNTSVLYGQAYTTQGAGSGVIYTQDGYIITNYHVVGKDTQSISVVLYDGSVHEAKYIYGDEFVDLSVIKIEKDDCDYATIGDFSQMKLGDEVLAIGNPLGYGLTCTDGIISALERSVTIENTTMTLLQTSAAINSGNSGGGLFNMRGELIGIVNAKIGGTSVEGMGYAIPSTTVVKSLNDLRTYGYITGKARLGVTVQTKTYQTWPYLQTYSYIQVAEIDEDGSAAKSGLQIGDILYKFNDTEISSFDILSQQLTKYKVGDTVTLTIRRPTTELTDNNLNEYLTTSETIELTITFVEFNPND